MGGGIRGNADADAKVSAAEVFGTRLSCALLATLLVDWDVVAASAVAADWRVTRMTPAISVAVAYAVTALQGAGLSQL